MSLKNHNLNIKNADKAYFLTDLQLYERGVYQ